MTEKIFEAILISLYVSLSGTTIAFLLSMPISAIIAIKKFAYKNILLSRKTDFISFHLAYALDI